MTKTKGLKRRERGIERERERREAAKVLKVTWRMEFAFLSVFVASLVPRRLALARSLSLSLSLSLSPSLSLWLSLVLAARFFLLWRESERGG